MLYHFLQLHRIDLPSPTELPAARKYAEDEASQVKIPLYGELTVQETRAIEALNLVRNGVATNITGIAQKLIKEHGLKNIDIPSLSEDIYNAIKNRAPVLVNTGEIHPFEESPETVAIMQAISDVGEYDPETLLSLDGGETSHVWKLRQTAYSSYTALKAHGILGSTVEKMVDNIATRSNRVLFGQIETLSCLHLVDAQVFDQLALYEKIQSEYFQLELLFITRCGLLSFPSILMSSQKSLLSQIKGEFGVTEEDVVMNPENENAGEATTPSVKQPKKS